MIEAIRVAATMSIPLVSSVGSVILPPIFLATPVNISAPIKFISAAIIMAVRGLSARVETEVAIALAVSWKPLMKSNASARNITKLSINNDVSIS
ncbi:hypothetical protein D3C86_2023230 [compost metagenome]